MNLIFRLVGLWIRKWPYQCCKWRLYQSGLNMCLSMNKVITATAITNHKYRVFTQDYAGSRLLVTGIWEPFVTMTIERILRPGDIFVDVGANFGYYSILASNLVQGSGKVIAFECNPNVAVLIKENIQLNNCKNIMLYEHALGDQEGNINFFLSSTDTGHGSLDRGENSKEISVQIHKFDDINLKLSIRLIKIDVEGAEFRVLKGMNKLLSSTSKPYVICEMSNKFNDRGGDSSKDILEYMHSFGYKAKFIPLSQSPYPPFESLSVEFEEATLEKILDSKDMRDILFVPIVNN